MAKVFPPNPQTIGSLHANNCTFAGTCRSGHASESFKVDMAKLIEQLGPDALVRDAMKAIACPRCGAGVAVTVAPNREVFGLGR